MARLISKKVQTCSVVCERLKTAKLIADYSLVRSDASDKQDGSLRYTNIEIIRAEHPLVLFIDNETYGKQSELYLRTDNPNALWQAMGVAGITLHKATRQENRIILPVARFRGWHWWE